MSPAFDIYCFQCPILILFLTLTLIHVPFVVLIPILHFVVLIVLPVLVLSKILVLVHPVQLRIQLRVVLSFERVARFVWQQGQDGLGSSVCSHTSLPRPCE